MREIRLRRLLVALAMAACGRYGATTENATDGGSSDGALMDAEAARMDAGKTPDAACDLGAPFGPLSRLDTVSDTLRNEWSAWISDDELTMVFTRQDNETQKNYLARRSSITTSFVQNSAVESDRTGERTAGPTIVTRAGGSELLFASAGTGVWGLYRAPIDVGTFAMGPSTLLLGLSVSAQLPAFADTSELYFIRGDYLGSGGQLYRTNVSAGGASPLEAVPEINGIFDSIGNMNFSPDGLTLYFGAKLFGSPTDFDIYRAKRNNKSAVFSGVERIDELATTTADFEAPLKISADGCRIYLSANRKGSSIDLFVASKPIKAVESGDR
jgi:hypothetical protein